MKIQGLLLLCIVAACSCNSRRGIALTKEMANAKTLSAPASKLITENASDYKFPVLHTIAKKQGDWLQELSPWLPDTQIFVCTNDRDVVLKGKQGTRVAIPSNTLETADGKPFTGDYTLQMLEYTTLKQCVAAGLTTQTENGDYLKTLGMVDIRCFAGEEELRIKQGENIGLAFPTTDDTSVYGSWSAVKNQAGQTEWRQQILPDAPILGGGIPEAPEDQTGLLYPRIYTSSIAKGKEGKNVNISLTSQYDVPLDIAMAQRIKFTPKLSKALENEGEYLAYKYRIDSMGSVADLQVATPGVINPSVISLSRKYKSLIQGYFDESFKIKGHQNLPKDAEFRFNIVGTGKPVGQIYTTSMAVKDLEKSTNVVDALGKTGYGSYAGSASETRAIAAKATRASKLLQRVLEAADDGLNAIMVIATLGLANCDAIGLPVTELKYKKAARVAVLTNGFKGMFYLVFKKVKTILSVKSEAFSRQAVFAPLLQKGLEYRLVAVTEKDGQFFISSGDDVVSENAVETGIREPYSKEKLDALLNGESDESLLPESK